MAATVGSEVGRHKNLARTNGSPWWEDVEGMADMIASGAQGNAVLSLMGGEPFLIKHTWRLLDALAERGVAQNLLVGLATNGQQQSTRLAELAPRFRGFNLTLSIDAHGKLYEYLRHGASWAKLADNICAFRQMANVDVAVVPTLQNCNALDMVTLLRFLDQHELRLAYNVVSWPARLSPANLPPSVRRAAAERLRAYQQDECRPANIAVVDAYIEALEEVGDEFDDTLFAEFMTFTNDLDVSRGQSLGEVAPELLALIHAAGVRWSQEHRHAAPRAAA
jgi:MoaA/NifB/PqqE/SkfB family radical SAM enzyme